MIQSILKKAVGGLVLLVLTACMQVQEPSYNASQIQLGFTTQNFLPSVPVSVESAKRFISYAADEDFAWIELRDPDASLTKEQCRQIAAFAERKGVKIFYSVQRGLLDEDFDAVFEKALDNAVVFDGPRLTRVLALKGKGELGWNETEFLHMVRTAKKASDAAAARGYCLMIENANTVLDGNGKDCFGMVQLLDAIDPGIELQLDTANLFTGPEPVSPEEAKWFINRYAQRIPYIHLKSAKNRQALPVLNGNPLDFKSILTLITKDSLGVYVAIELASGDRDFETVCGNISTSVRYLVRENILPGRGLRK